MRWFLIVFFLLRFSLAQSLPANYESYADRPDILNARPQTHNHLAPEWTAHKWGHLEAVAQLIEMYPDHEIYFLARDSEQLYELSRLALAHEPSLQKRMHLLNVSRTNITSPHIDAYLAQEGISEESLSAGKKILLVDVGIYGTILSGIASRFSSEAQKNIQKKLLGSKTPSIPGTRVYLGYFDPTVSIVETSQSGVIFALEGIPRFIDRSFDYMQIDGVWQPISQRNSETDGIINKVNALKLQEDLTAFWHQPEVQNILKNRRRIYRQLRILAKKDDKSQLEKQAIQFLATTDASKPIWLRRAMIEDILDIMVKNFHVSEKHFTRISYALKQHENAVIEAVRKRDQAQRQSAEIHKKNNNPKVWSCEKLFSR